MPDAPAQTPIRLIVPLDVAVEMIAQALARAAVDELRKKEKQREGKK